MPRIEASGCCNFPLASGHYRGQAFIVAPARAVISVMLVEDIGGPLPTSRRDGPDVTGEELMN
jgi:hypothetical protein